MAKAGEHADIVRAAQMAVNDGDGSVQMAIKVTKSQAFWSVTGRRARLSNKPRVLAVTAKQASKEFKVNLYVLKITSSGLEQSKVYKLKHLKKVEAVPTDTTGCTFVLGFDNLKSQSVAPPQWITRSIDDRNRLFTSILKLCKENIGTVPKIVGMDVVEMALWAQANARSLPIEGPVRDDAAIIGTGLKQSSVTVERDLVSKAEEDDMEALLDSYVLGIDEAEAFSEKLRRELLALDAANVHAILESEPLIEQVLQLLDGAASSVDDLDEWLGIFNVKLRHMREDIESIESRNNKLDMQTVNNASLYEELNKLLDRLRVPSEYGALLTSGRFDEERIPQYVEACEWLTQGLRGLEPPLLDASYANMRAVRERQAELEKLKLTFVKRASEYLGGHFSSFLDYMISDKTHFSQTGQLKRPDHADLRFKCRTYARLLQHLKALDKGSLDPLRKAYCHSLNLLLRREAREFANELRASSKVTRNANGGWLEGGAGGSQTSGNSDNSVVLEAYSKMLRIFIPLLVDESTFFASFMCFDIAPLVPHGDRRDKDYKGDLRPMDSDEQSKEELEALNQALKDLLDGIQEDFYAVVDWACKLDPLRCISMNGATERFLSSSKADAAGFVRQLLDDLQDRINTHFYRFIDEACHQIEKHDRNVKQVGVLTYIPRFALLAQRMEGLITGNSRVLVDQAYSKLIDTMFNVLERIAQVDPKHADILLFENYAAFQNSLFEIANVVPTLHIYYHKASDAYDQACTRYVNSVINYQFEKLFQFSKRVENLLLTVTPDEVSYQLGVNKTELRKVLKASLSGVRSLLQAMYKRMQKQLTSEELLPSLWGKCMEIFLNQYEGLEALLAKCYPSEVLSPSCAEMKELFKTL